MTETCVSVLLVELDRPRLRLYDWSLYLTPGEPPDAIGIAVEPEDPMAALCRAASTVTAALTAAGGGWATIVELERDDVSGTQHATGNAVRAAYVDGAVRWLSLAPEAVA